MAKNKRYQSIPTTLEEDEFNEFVLPYLTKGSRGPGTKLTFYRLFNYLLKLMHTGCQWEELPIEKDAFGKPEIHHTRLFRTFKRWLKDGCFENIFIGSVSQLFNHNLLDTKVIHGDGSTTCAKKGAII
ncbi:transposase [Candidatus Paracaedibacter symbiosus]|uniref:transposase n=1 Tax=Candidatus Paracaedibacter symbiosus TaxID=244582 RepID=UPI00094E1F8C|nr:transposase [Candidatus Paracaedibacter symbiosus]